MFNRARIKLTGWYLLIIMVISLAFSAGIYRVLASELDRVERIQRSRITRQLSLTPGQIAPRRVIDKEVIEETKNRLTAILVLINLGIFSGSTVLGYFLAGRTSKPIKEMVDEQERFITNASHELRTPLTSLKSEIEVGLRNKQMTTDKARKLLTSNLEEVNNLQYLSDNLIKLTRYQKGNDANFENVNLRHISEEAIKKVGNLAKRKNITIKNNIKAQIIEAERQSLLEMFVIFLDNSIKYSSKGKKISLASKKRNGNMEIEISDQGVGIDEKDLPHLFDRFYRADKSRSKSDIAGYGLGLSIAKQIIEKHNGTVKVNSMIDKGTTFTIQLPI